MTETLQPPPLRATIPPLMTHTHTHTHADAIVLTPARMAAGMTSRARRAEAHNHAG